VLEVGWDEVRARRLARSSLGTPAAAGELVAVAGALCGVHAQVQASAEVQVAARLDGVVQADVREALWERRALVKAWTVRGTLHVHPAEELPLWLAADARFPVRPTADCRWRRARG
jgi:winged helix DNA-binding protein